jgi:hypothetical protein
MREPERAHGGRRSRDKGTDGLGLFLGHGSRQRNTDGPQHRSGFFEVRSPPIHALETPVFAKGPFANGPGTLMQRSSDQAPVKLRKRATLLADADGGFPILKF